MDPLSAVAVPIIETVEQSQSQNLPGDVTSSTRSAADPPAQRRLVEPLSASDEENNGTQDEEAVSDEDEKFKEEEVVHTLMTTSDPSQQAVSSAASTKKSRWGMILCLALLAAVGLATVGGVCATGRCRSTDSNPQTEPKVADLHTNRPVTSMQTPAPSPLAKLEQLVANGQLSCGVMDLPGQSEAASSGQREGFSIDLVSRRGVNVLRKLNSLQSRPSAVLSLPHCSVQVKVTYWRSSQFKPQIDLSCSTRERWTS